MSTAMSRRSIFHGALMVSGTKINTKANAFREMVRDCCGERLRNLLKLSVLD